MLSSVAGRARPSQERPTPDADLAFDLDPFTPRPPSSLLANHGPSSSPAAAAAKGARPYRHQAHRPRQRQGSCVLPFPPGAFQAQLARSEPARADTCPLPSLPSFPFAFLSASPTPSCAPCALLGLLRSRHPVHCRHPGRHRAVRPPELPSLRAERGPSSPYPFLPSLVDRQAQPARARERRRRVHPHGRLWPVRPAVGRPHLGQVSRPPPLVAPPLGLPRPGHLHAVPTRASPEVERAAACLVSGRLLRSMADPGACTRLARPTGRSSTSSPTRPC